MVRENSAQLWVDDGQLEELLERIEVSIAVEQRVMFAQTEGGDQAVDVLSHRMTTTPKGAIVTRRVAGKRNAAGFEDDQLRELAFDGFRRSVITDALQHLAEDDVRQPEALALKCSVEPVRFRIPHALEVVDQNRRVDDDHVRYFA